MNQLFEGLDALQKNRLLKTVRITIIMLAVFLTVETISVLKEYSYIGRDISLTNTITVSGIGETFAIPDIATFSFSVIENGKTTKEAQDKATVKTNAIIDAMKKMGIEDKDIKTTGYNAYPRYDYVQTQVACVSGQYCPPGKQVLTGYEVNQSITIKIRKTDDAGTALTKVGELGASNISGLDFTIDDIDKVKAEARDIAIKDAKEKAKVLARSLGIELRNIINFQENNNQPQPYYGLMSATVAKMQDAVSTTPATPMGENKVTSNVTITYEIR